MCNQFYRVEIIFSKSESHEIFKEKLNYVFNWKLTNKSFIAICLSIGMPENKKHWQGIEGIFGSYKYFDTSRSWGQRQGQSQDSYFFGILNVIWLEISHWRHVDLRGRRADCDQIVFSESTLWQHCAWYALWKWDWKQMS